MTQNPHKNMSGCFTHTLHKFWLSFLINEQKTQNHQALAGILLSVICNSSSASSATHVSTLLLISHCLISKVSQTQNLYSPELLTCFSFWKFKALCDLSSVSFKVIWGFWVFLQVHHSITLNSPNHQPAVHGLLQPKGQYDYQFSHFNICHYYSYLYSYLCLCIKHCWRSYLLSP